MIERIMHARGMTDAGEIARFCEPKLTDLHDPGLMHGIDAAVTRIIDAVKRGLARDPKQLPRIERFKGAANGAATVELLKVLLRMTSERHGVAAKVIATVDELDRIAADDDANVPALKGWRRELFGEKALALKHGKLALAIENGRVVTSDRS